MANVTKCVCGKRMSKYARFCLQCDGERRDARHVEARAIVATGKCPQCGAGLKLNSSMRGWWQCEQYGADTHRQDPSKPKCGFQTFTE